MTPKLLLPAESLWKQRAGHGFWGCPVPVPVAGYRFFTLATGRPLLCFAFFFFFPFRATPATYGSSQLRGLIGAVATSLHHSKGGCEPHL